ncbi:ABC transporter permease [Acutalibacter intestini]|uniref:ABC transporter permease n=1 Tax=Acutalibacter intestini TaxID=3093659 RepID=UPI002AC987FF|nr:ABC transporter permease subunit [Acutalibacter sp. M00204]
MKKYGFFHELKKNKALFLMAAPSILLTFFLSYLPMSGLVLAFKNYRYDKGIFGSDWNGFDNFAYLFQSGAGWTITRNTILYNLLNLITSQLLAVIVAIVISEMIGKLYKRVVQSVIFLPYFISWVIVGVFAFNLFNYETGAVNNLLHMLGMEPMNFYTAENAWWWVIIICCFNMWKWTGYNSIIYIAAITSIDAECYEAADIDGANIFQKIWYITFPAIKPTIITMILLQVGRILRGDFEMFYQLIGSNGQLFDMTDVIDTYVFRSLTTSANLGMTAAASFYQSALCFIIIMVVNQVVRKIEEEYALF